jgi:hypothetical protein
VLQRLGSICSLSGCLESPPDCQAVSHSYSSFATITAEKGLQVGLVIVKPGSCMLEYESSPVSRRCLSGEFLQDVFAGHMQQLWLSPLNRDSDTCKSPSFALVQNRPCQGLYSCASEQTATEIQCWFSAQLRVSTTIVCLKLPCCVVLHPFLHVSICLPQVTCLSP